MIIHVELDGVEICWVIKGIFNDPQMELNLK